jgi:hypothetical protein
LNFREKIREVVAPFFDVLAGRLGSLAVTFGDSKTMNIIRIKIICSWLLLVLFGLLLCFSWRYRFLWVAVLPAAIVILELIKPRCPPMPLRLKARLKVLLWLMAIVWVLTVVFNGFLYPHSVGLYLLGKIACVAAAVPLFCFKVWLDYAAWGAVQHASAEPGAPPNAGSAGAPPASVS